MAQRIIEARKADKEVEGVGNKSKMCFNVETDTLFTYRRGQSQKPEEIYELAESLVQHGFYIEIFARRNNLHNGWVALGNEI